MDVGKLVKDSAQFFAVLMVAVALVIIVTIAIIGFAAGLAAVVG